MRMAFNEETAAPSTHDSSKPRADLPQHDENTPASVLYKTFSEEDVLNTAAVHNVSFVEQ